MAAHAVTTITRALDVDRIGEWLGDHELKCTKGGQLEIRLS